MLTIKRFRYIEVPFIYCIVKPLSSMETRSIQTSHCYGQFALSLGTERPFIFYPLNKVTLLIRTLSQYGPFSVGIYGVWLYYFWGGEYRLLLKIELLENAILVLWLAYPSWYMGRHIMLFKHGNCTRLLKIKNKMKIGWFTNKVGKNSRYFVGVLIESLFHSRLLYIRWL